MSIYLKKTTIEKYILTFGETLKSLCEVDLKKEATEKVIHSTSPNNSERDKYLPIYMWCKNLWDKWLIAGDNTKTIPYKNNFTVSKFFQSFMFIDSFYRNIYNDVNINCQKFLNLVDSLASKTTKDATSLYSFLGNLTAESRCLFVAVPNYINLGENNQSGATFTNNDTMNKLFKAIPIEEMSPLSENNKFIVIYTHEPSKISSSKSIFLKDCFDICDDEGNITEDAKGLFGTVGQSLSVSAGGGYNNNMITKAYPVPGFGVSLKGQHNHMFKAVDVNMDNPIATEHSISIMTNIAQLGSGQGQSVAYQGQDIYPIFSNYAYQSTVTMMGNAQIQPLMYYQLMNIPMWKGSYMIFNVKHSITPGNMTTTFTGMRMSKNCIPYVKKWAKGVENICPAPQVIINSTESTYTNYNAVYTGDITPWNVIDRSNDSDYKTKDVEDIKAVAGRGKNKIKGMYIERAQNLIVRFQNEFQWNYIQALGLVGALIYESALNEKATSSTGCCGLAQWCKDRRKPLWSEIPGYNYNTQFVRGNGSTYPSYEQQVDSVVREIKNSYSRFRTKIYTEARIGNDLRYALELAIGYYEWGAGFCNQVKGQVSIAGLPLNGVWKNYECAVCSIYKIAGAPYGN